MYVCSPVRETMEVQERMVKMEMQEFKYVCVKNLC